MCTDTWYGNINAKKKVPACVHAWQNRQKNTDIGAAKVGPAMAGPAGPVPPPLCLRVWEITTSALKYSCRERIAWWSKHTPHRKAGGKCPHQGHSIEKRRRFQQAGFRKPSKSLPITNTCWSRLVAVWECTSSLQAHQRAGQSSDS